MIAKQFKDMEMSKEEFVCFRAITLLNAGNYVAEKVHVTHDISCALH